MFSENRRAVIGNGCWSVEIFDNNNHLFVIHYLFTISGRLSPVNSIRPLWQHKEVHKAIFLTHLGHKSRLFNTFSRFKPSKMFIKNPLLWKGSELLLLKDFFTSSFKIIYTETFNIVIFLHCLFSWKGQLWPGAV